MNATSTLPVLPARYQAQVWVNDTALDTDEGTTDFDAEFYVAQLTDKELDDLCREPDGYVDQNVMEYRALAYGTVSEHNGPFFIYLDARRVIAWRAQLRRDARITAGQVRGLLHDDAVSPPLSEAIVRDIFAGAHNPRAQPGRSPALRLGLGAIVCPRSVGRVLAFA